VRWQPEHGLGDRVAVNLGRACTDGRGPAHQVAVRPPTAVDGISGPVAQRRIGSRAPQRQSVQTLFELGFHQAVHRRHAAGILTAEHRGQGPRAVGGDGAHVGFKTCDLLQDLRVTIQPA